jgi:hypothetical protein
MVAAATLVVGCTTDPDQQLAAESAGAGASQSQGGSAGSTAQATTSSSVGAGGMGGTLDPGPNVDTSDPQLYEMSFTPDQADPAASLALATQLAYLDTRVEPRGYLVVYLHGAGAPSTCGSSAHGQLLAGMGFHVISPCYVSDYGVGNCGDDIEGCRLEAFEGVDHHSLIDISPPDSTETRVVKGLAYVQAENPEGDWTYFIDGDKPKWHRIIISGISHGASSSGVIGLHRLVDRAVMLSGPLDSGQAWLQKSTMTPIDRFYGFSHTGDGQHPGHLLAFEDMGLPGDVVSVDDATAPYGGSHRLISSAPTTNGHGSTQAGGASPQEGNAYVFLPVWQTIYGVSP